MNQETTSTPASTHQFLRLRQVTQMTGFSRSSIYRLMGLGEFPRQVKLGQRAAGWRASDLEAWAKSRTVAHER